MAEPRAEGEAFNIGDSKPLTQVELVEKLAKAANVDPALVRMPRDIIAQAGGNAMAEPFYFGEYFDVPPITEYIGKVTRLLKIDADAVRGRAEGDLPLVPRNHKPRTAGFEFDDKLLGMARTGSPASEGPRPGGIARFCAPAASRGGSGELQHHHGDVVRLRGAFRERSHAGLNGIVKRRA